MKKRIRVTYYALLRQERGITREEIETEANTVQELFKDLKDLHGFTISEFQVKAAINSQACNWNTALNEGDSLLFIPPVAGRYTQVNSKINF